MWSLHIGLIGGQECWSYRVSSGTKVDECDISIINALGVRRDDDN